MSRSITAAQPKTILYVDDNALDRELVRHALLNADQAYKIVEASSQEEFDDAVTQGPYDAVLSDFDICGFQGLQVLARVKELWPEVPVIIVTGTGTEEIAVEAMKSGAADYIIKSPKAIERLPGALANTLNAAGEKRARNQAERELKESEARFHRAVEEAPVPVMIHAEDGEVLAVSHVWLSVTGYSIEQVSTVGAWTELAYGNAAKTVLEYVEKTYHGTEPFHEGEFTVHCADGTDRIWDFSSTPLGPGQDGRRCAISIASDVTERKSLEAQLRHAQKMEAVGRLAGGVAHDFSNMLQVIMGYLTLGLEELPDRENPPTWFGMIQRAADRSADLTRQLLAFSRNEAAEPKLVELGPAVSRLSTMLERIVGEEVTLSTTLQRETWPIRIDPAQLDSIIANLVINARDAMDNSGVLAIATFNHVLSEEDSREADTAPGDYAAISVKDTGTGMDRETLDHIFDPFFTTKGPGVGTGLGLSVVYGTVKQNGGFLRVESEPGAGTTVIVYLPRCRPEVAPEAAHPTEDAASRGQGIILLVEDDEAVLEVTERLLSRIGYRTVATKSPAHALELAAEDLPEITLVMSDVVMPEVDGPTLVERLQALRPGTPALFTSGYPSEVIGSHGIVPGTVHFLQKPYDQKKLAQKIREVLGGESK